MTNIVTGIKLHSYIKLKSAWANHEKLWISASSGKKTQYGNLVSSGCGKSIMSYSNC